MKRFSITVILALIILLFPFYLFVDISEEKVSGVRLTLEEQKWLDTHSVVKVASKNDIPPFDFIQNGQTAGFSIELLDLIAKKTGLILEYVSDHSWKQLLERFKRDEIDVFPAVYRTRDREDFMNFTTPYLVNPIVLVKNSMLTDISSLNDLVGDSIAVVKGFAIESVIAKKYPEIKRIEVKNVLDGLKQVSLKNVSAYVGDYGIIDQLLKENVLPNLEILDEKTLFQSNNNALHIGVTKKKIILRNIIQKGLNRVTEKELNALKAKWLPTVSKDEYENIDYVDNLLSKTILKMIGITFLLIALIFAIYKQISSKFTNENRTVDFSKIQLTSTLASSILVALVVVIAWLSLNQIEKDIRSDLKASLDTVLKTTNESLKLWIDSNIYQLEHDASDPEFVKLVEKLLSVHRSKDSLLKSACLNKIRNYFNEERSKINSAGFFIIAPDYTNIGSRRDKNVGDVNLISLQRKELLDKVFKGKSQFIPPILSDVKVTKNDQVIPPTMFYAVPVKNKVGEVIAVLTQREIPMEHFDRLCSMGRIGNTGETFVFDFKGTMLSSSRFENELKEQGLLKENQLSILNVKLNSSTASRNKHNLYPFMQNKVKDKHEEKELQEYLSYRGVKVFGCWQNNEDYNFGIAVEYQVDEALANFTLIRNIVVFILSIIVVISIGLTLFITIFGKRTHLSLKKLNDELEDKVDKRTKELRSANKHLENTLEALTHPFYVIDANTYKITLANHAAKELSSEDVSTCHLLTHNSNTPCNSKDHPCPLEIVKQTKKPVMVEHIHYDKNKQPRYVEIHGYPILDEAGEVSQMIEYLLDITERKNAENEIKKFSIVVEQSPNSILVTDPKGRIEYVNPKFTEITGYTLKEVLGKNPRILNSGSQPKKIYKHLWKTILSGQEWHGELRNRKKNGEIYWESASISPMINEDNEIVSFIAVKENITDKKLAEKELRKAKEAAEAATKAKSDFLANMSHEIRTPMNAILGLSNLVLKTDLSPKQRDYLAKIDHSAKALLGIINDILDFSKIEAGKLDMEVIEFDLNDVLHSLSNLVLLKAQEKGLELIFNIDHTTPYLLKGDSLRLGQILINLINNAIKFTDNGEIVLNVKPIELQEDEVFLEFSVRDTGIGMSEEQQKVLFQSFQQADTSTTRKYGGTGLGLSICKRLVEMMDGEIKVESTLGSGSTFKFSAKFGRHKCQVRKLFTTPEFLKDLKVLIADDNETFSLVMKKYLEEFGFIVTKVNSAMEAIKTLEKAFTDNQRPYDLLFMDWQMPEMDGLEGCRKIKSNEKICKKPKIIMITGFGREDVMQQAESLELDGFLLKPVTQSFLFDDIMQAYGQEVEYKSKYSQANSDTPEGFNLVRGAKILLVEDNEVNQQVALELLKAEGFFTDIAENGQVAIDKVLNNEYEIVLMDLQMPVMDGYTATKEIRKHYNFNELPIIAMTADAMSGVREKTVDLGMNDYVTKPIEPKSLFQALTKWLKPEKRDLPERYKVVPEKRIKKDNTLPELPGVDTENGIKRVGGSLKSYQELFLKFIENQVNIPETIQLAVSSNNFEAAAREAHTLKGVAGNIGAYRISELAREIEKLLKAEEYSEIESYTEKITYQFNMLKEKMDSFSILSDKKEELHKNKEISINNIKDDLIKLKYLLEVWDTEAQDVLEELNSTIEGSALYNEFKKVSKLVNDYKNEEAIEELEKVCGKFDLEV